MKQKPILLAPLALLFLLLLAATSSAGEVPSLTTIEPDNVRRGNTATVVISGLGLDVTTGVSFDDPRIDVLDLQASASMVAFEITVGQRALAGEKTMTLSFSVGPDLVHEDALEVIPGEVALFGVEPDTLQRGDADTIVLHGLNLDAALNAAFGDGITISGFVVDPQDPTRATADVTVTPAARAGRYDVTLETDDLDAVLFGGFDVVPGSLDVTDLQPQTLTRGDIGVLTIAGSNLDAVENVNLGNGVAVESITVNDPTDLSVLVSVLDESLPIGTSRDVIFTGGPEVVTLTNALTIEPGTPGVTRVRPNRLSQGTTSEITVEGVNLDEASAVTAGAGVAAVAVDSLSPSRLVVQLAVTLDAAVGERDVIVTGSLGSATAFSALTILERIEPDPRVNFPSVLDLGRVELSARKRIAMLFINENDISEEVSLEVVGGDINEFAIYDESGQTLDERYPETLEFVLGPLAERLISAEYRPTLRTSSFAELEVTVRGAVQGSVELRGTGALTVLTFSPLPPLLIPPVIEGGIGVRQVSTLSATPDRTVIEGVDFLVERNNGVFATSEELTTITLSEPLRPELEILFGATLITIETDYPAGSYEGQIWFSTNRSSAPILPLAFNTTVMPVPMTDGDSGEGPPEPAPDAGPDVVSDGGGDAPRTDLPDAMGEDIPADSGDVRDSADADGTGCCRQVSTPGRSTGPAALLAGLVWLAGWRRRPRRF